MSVSRIGCGVLFGASSAVSQMRYLPGHLALGRRAIPFDPATGSLQPKTAESFH